MRTGSNQSQVFTNVRFHKDLADGDDGVYTSMYF